MALSTLQPGSMLNQRYRIVRILGQGGFGIVYLGKTMSGQPVAIKQNLETDPASRDQFKREAELVRPLRHKNLVRVEDYFEDANGSQYMVMEFIPGDDLLEIAKKRSAPFPETEVLQWGALLCDVLAYLHSRTPPIIHRDIKPQNVKIDPNGRLVLIDFGIAKEFRTGQKTVRGARAASEGYSPLEQYGQSSAGTTSQTDIYALGATLFYLLTKQNPEGAMERVQKQTQLDVWLFNRSVSSTCAQAIIKATEIKPQDRYLSASDFKRALTLALQAQGSTAPQPQSGVVCLRCGKLNRTGAHMCSQCGNALISVPTQGVPCPHCGKINRQSARVCSNCGMPLAKPSLPSPVPPRPSIQPGRIPPYPLPNAPSPIPVKSQVPAIQPVINLAHKQRISGAMLMAMGALGIVIAVFQISQNVFPLSAFPLIGLSIFSLIAGRDVADLFSDMQHRLPSWLGFAFDSPNRGRRWGTIVAVLWIIVGIAIGWLIIPLALAGGMAYVLNILIGEAFVQHTGGHYSRPGWVTVIGWLLAFSGIGTVPGIALLIPKKWAPPWAQRALAALALVAVGGVVFALVNLNATNPPWLLAVTLPGSGLRVVTLCLLTLSLGVIVTAIPAIQYLEKVQLNFTQTAMRRELNVGAWMLFAMGGLVLLAALATIGISDMGFYFWIGVPIGALAISGARDLLNLGSRWFSVGSRLAGDPELGRRKGIVAMMALSIVSAIAAYLIVPFVFLGIAIFILRILMSDQSIYICGGKPGAPAGLLLIAWLLVPTGLGTVPGLWMLRKDARGWKLARLALVILGIAGLAGALLALPNAIPGAGTIIVPAATAATAGVALALSSGLALVYLQSSKVRRYFGV